MAADQTSNRGHIFVVDDDPSLQRVLSEALREEGYGADIFSTANDVVPKLDGEAEIAPDLIILDLNLPGMGGLEALEQWRDQGVDLPVIVLTAQNTVENAIRAMQLGAFDYVTKPFDLDDLYDLVRKAMETRRETAQQDKASAPDHGLAGRTPLVGTGRKMQDVYKTIGKTAATDATVLLIGESGTGKELVARAIHDFSPRCDEAFVAVNAAAIPGELLEAELFGYEKGAFTGATQASPGKFREANQGTLLLDEIGDMPLGLQAKLLRVLQEREITPLGGRRAVPVDVRVIAATQRPLEAAMESGEFRPDLYFRLNVVELRLPPLRERREDIEPLCALFLDQMFQRGEIPPKEISDDALAMLATAEWPGNVRQLENLVRRVALLSPHRVLDVVAFQEFGGEAFADAAPERVVEDTGGFAQIVEQSLKPYVQAMHDCGDQNVWQSVMDPVERVLLTLALIQTQGNQLRAAELLGINRNTLRKKLSEHKINPKGYRKGDE